MWYEQRTTSFYIYIFFCLCHEHGYVIIVPAYSPNSKLLHKDLSHNWREETGEGRGQGAAVMPVIQKPRYVCQSRGACRGGCRIMNLERIGC